MSRKAHPIGLRLGLSQSWKLAVNTQNYREMQAREFFIWRWFFGFCKTNFFYLFEFKKLFENKSTLLFSFVFFSDIFLRRTRGIYKLLINQRRYYYRTRKQRSPRQHLLLRFYKRRQRMFYVLRYLERKRLNLAGFQAGLKNRTFSKYFSFRSIFVLFFRKPAKFFDAHAYYTSRQLVLDAKRLKEKSAHRRQSHSSQRMEMRGASFFSSRQEILRVKQDFLRLLQNSNIMRSSRSAKRVNLRAISLNFLKIIHSRIVLLRLKGFLENTLSHLVHKQVILLPTNLGYLFFDKAFLNSSIARFKTQSNDWKSVNRQVLALYMDLKTKYTFYFPQQFVSLMYLAGVYEKPEVFLQWFLYYVRRVRKHSVTITQNKIIDLFSGALENLLFFAGILDGYRLEISGKVGGSERTRKQIFTEGSSLARQTFHEQFRYAYEAVPTYASILGVRLWLKY